MDGRFNPYDSPGQHRQQAHALQAALEMEEALYLQRQQQEMQRDLQIRQMLLQDQIDQQLMQAPAASLLHQQRMYELQNYAAAQNPLAALHEEQLLQQQIQQQEQLRRQQLQQELHLSAALANQQSPRRDFPDGLVADSISAPQAAATRPSGPLQRKRSLSHEEAPGTKPPPRKQQKKERSNSVTVNEEHKDIAGSTTTKKPRAKPGKKPASDSTDGGGKTFPSSVKENGDESKAVRRGSKESSAPQFPGLPRGTVEELVAAAKAEQQVQDAASVVVGLQRVEWSDSEPEDETPAESIELPGFSSQLPRLPEEPEYDSSRDRIPKQGGRSVNGVIHMEASTGLTQLKHTYTKKGSAAASKGSGSALKSKPGSETSEYPYPVDTWWPSSTTIRRERRIRGEKSDEEECADEPILSTEETLFRADLPSIRSRLVNDVEPGVLEKLPHCKIHKMRIKGQKGGVAKAEPVFCWQVTENTCNDVMLCCSVCSTWRHAFCGGHYKPYTIRGMLDSDTPFAPVCDRCHEEKEVMRDFPKAQARIDRQRTEQLRRGLSTSAVIRQASFAKHGGTYKWPLGSVSATHIGGHTRSVHSRHDKAEKQWAEMAVRLGRGLGYRPKERVKVRTRELERLLVSVEDAEGIMDRHNMMLFLQRDTSKDHPVGFERNRRNLFDPEDDYIEEVVQEQISEMSSKETPEKEKPNTDDDHIERGCGAMEDTTDSVPPDEENEKKNGTTEKLSPRRCARIGCSWKPRFDSMFCSDSCGVSALELNLLRSMEYAGDIHPSLLRS